MQSPDDDIEKPTRHGMRFGEFVALIAAIMAVTALGIDTMLPALGEIARELDVREQNHQQLVILVFFAGLGVGQLFWGPIADRFGRRPVLFATLAIYAAMSFVAAVASSFELLLVARLTQGLSSAATRVLAVSIVRDCYVGRRMAKVISFSFIVFMAVPILAPSLGQMLLLVMPWHGIFVMLGLYALSVAGWIWLRLPETLDPADRMPISARTMVDAARFFVSQRQAICYTLAHGVAYGGMVGFLNSSPQIVGSTFGRPDLFPVAFGASAAFMVLASLMNARFVERFGMRILAHSALTGLFLVSLLHLSITLAGWETLPLFILLIGLSMFCNGLAGSNFGALAMEPMGHIAGTAASLQGFLSTLTGALIGLVIGQSFTGSTLPLTIGWGLAGIASFALVAVAERGRLFTAHGERTAAPPL